METKQLGDILEGKGIDVYDDSFKIEDWMIKQGFTGLSCEPIGSDCECFIKDDTLGACGEGCLSCYPITKEPND